MSKELFKVDEPSLKPSLLDLLPEYSYGMLGLIAKSRDQFHKLWSSEARQEVLSGHTNWDTTSLCRRLSQDATQQYTVDELLTTVSPNFEALTDEYCLGTPIKAYRFSLLKTAGEDVVGTNGIGGTYKENAGDQAARFQQEKIARTGKRQQRAAIETYNSQRLDDWIISAFQKEDVPFGTKLVWFSPPGWLVEGYFGVSKKDHSFIWVYEKKEDEEGAFIEMTQLRCWPSLEQLQAVQRELESSSIQTGMLKSFPEVPHLTKRNQVISKMIELPLDHTMDQIYRSVFSSEQSWAVKTQDMPSIKLSQSIQSFYKQRAAILETFLLPIYAKVLHNTTTEELLTRPLSDPFWRSEAYREVITELDLAFAVSKQALEKWIENGIDWEQTHQNQAAVCSAAINLEDLRVIYQLSTKNHINGLSLQEKEKFNALAPVLLSAGGRLLSIGQCGIGTLIPLNLVAKLNLAGVSSATSGLAQMGSSKILELSHEEKAQFQKEVLGLYAPLTVKDRQGASHLFWVRKEYYSDYAGHCFENADGILVGPCGVPLTMEEDEFILTNEKYQELLGATRLDQRDTELKKLQLEEQQRLNEAMSEAEKENIKAEFKNRRDRLKHRISITELLNDDIAVSFPRRFAA